LIITVPLHQAWC